MSTPAFDYDAELRRYQPWLRSALAVAPADTVLDVGCGAGSTTCEAARLATRGSALGIDVSGPRLELARRLAAAQNVPNVRFERADAATHPFARTEFSLAFSRFGTMFFADPLAAFTNLAHALRPGARLVQLVWQPGDRQEWVAEIGRAVGTPDVVDDSPFSLGDPAVVGALLTTAGFTDVRFTDLAEPLWYGPDPATAVAAVRPLRLVIDALARLDTDETDQALDRLHAVLATHRDDDGVWLGSRAWLVTASRGSD
ncbi:methyltransferase domain-containing protein [Amycolatopsis rhabdoformis]|uniref:Methyltransferase domain-containing protein n=1 Tax=Amycolatopsis rhabdoformis TaxID=1448059 RepID=A0ABZ1I807_9PSEU|nr:methyltransferase domain-containing protein [Amycolatopsis rhabdoformis]WSE29831.1 methyltransferase domain-containing protein [Amycolatopsis rhabdoformis]